MQKYIKEENKKRKKNLLVGGIIIKQGEHFLINSDEVYTSFGRSADRVEDKIKDKYKGWRYLEF